MNDKFKIMLIKNDQIDSLSIFEVGDKTIINTNDCVLNNKKLNIIKKKLLYKNQIFYLLNLVMHHG